MNKPVLNMRNQNGFTIAELMVGATVSLVMLAILSQVFWGARINYTYQTAMARMQESGRFATALLAQDVRSAGFQGCGSIGITANVLTDSASKWWLDTATPIRGYNSVTGFPSGTGGLPSDAITTSDAIALIRIDSFSERLVTAHDPSTATLTVASAHPFNAGEVLFVTDCQNSAFFQMSGPSSPTPPALTIQHTTGNTSLSPNNCQANLGGNCGSAVGHTFAPGGLVARLVSNIYFIKPSASGNGNALWTGVLSRSGSAATVVFQEMVPGIQAMSILYGVNDIGDPDSSADRYLRAAEVNSEGQRGQIVSVKIELLMRSEGNNLASAPQTYVFNGSSVTAVDRHLYKVLSTTFNLRNRTT